MKQLIPALLIVAATSASAQGISTTQSPVQYALSLIRDRYIPAKLSPDEITILVRTLTKADVYYTTRADGLITFWVQDTGEGGRITMLSQLYQYRP